MELKLLTKMRLAKNEVESGFKMVSFIKDYPDELQFQIAVPRDWNAILEKTVIPNSDTPIVTLGKLKSNLPSEAEMTISSAFLPREMHPSDWLEAWFVSQDYTAVDGRMVETSFGVISDIIATRTINKKAYICRLTAIKDADRIFLLVARVKTQKASEFDVFQDVFLMAIKTLKLLHPTKQKFAEAFDWVEFNLSSKMRCLVPYSWQKSDMVDVPPTGVGKVFKNQLKDVVLGSIFAIRVERIEGTPLNVESTLISKIKNNGFVINSESSKVISESTLSSGLKVVVKQQSADKDGNGYILMSTNYISEKGSFFLMLLSPDKITNFEAWAINRRAFQVIGNSVEFL